MSIRTINFKVEADKITPSSLQRGGLQGEHNATELVFKVENSLVEKLLQASMGASIYFRFEGHTGMGLKNSTLPVVLNIPDDYSNGFYLNYLLENWLTHEGGNITVYLIFSVLSNTETLVDLYSYPARLRLEAVPDGKYTDGKNYESVAKLSVAAEDAAERAENAAEISEAAKERTVDARFALENGAVFVFMGGDAKGAAEVDLVVDSELSEYSQNPISNETTAKEFQKYTPTELADEMYVGADDYALDKENADKERSEMKEKLDNIADYIVERGVLGIWTYEKWNNGEIKCYGKFEYQFTDLYSATENFYKREINIPIPSGLLIKKPSVAFGNADVPSMINIFLWRSSDTNLNVEFNTVYKYDNSNECALELFFIGTWK